MLALTDGSSSPPPTVSVPTDNPGSATKPTLSDMLKRFNDKANAVKAADANSKGDDDNDSDSDEKQVSTKRPAAAMKRPAAAPAKKSRTDDDGLVFDNLKFDPKWVGKGCSPRRYGTVTIYCDGARDVWRVTTLSPESLTKQNVGHATYVTKTFSHCSGQQTTVPETNTFFQHTVRVHPTFALIWFLGCCR